MRVHPDIGRAGVRHEFESLSWGSNLSLYEVLGIHVVLDREVISAVKHSGISLGSFRAGVVVSLVETVFESEGLVHELEVLHREGSPEQADKNYELHRVAMVLYKLL